MCCYLYLARYNSNIMSVTISEISTNSTHLSGNPIWVKCTSSGIPAGATDYKILLKVESPDDVLFGDPFTDAITPDSLVAWFNISGYVDQEIEKNIHWPVDSWITAYTSLAYDIWLYPGESYIDEDGELQESFGSVVEPFFMVKGKLSDQKLAELNDAGSDWFDYFSTDGRFLTWQPATQTVGPYQPVKLWYKYPSASPASRTLTYTGYFDDGSTQTITNTPTLSRASLYEFDLLPEEVGFTLDNGSKKLIKYTFTATGCETRTFIIDWRTYDYNYYLFADNQIGGVDCIWLKGRARHMATANRIIAGKPADRGSGVQVPTLLVSGNTRQRKWVINTGIKSKEELNALDILLDTPNAWLATPPADGSTDLDDYTLTRVIIISSEIVLSDDTKTVESIDIEIIEAHE